MLGGTNWGAAFERLSRSQYQPATGVNGKRRIEPVDGDSAFGCIVSGGSFSTSVGVEGTFMFGRLLHDGEELRDANAMWRAQDVQQS